jgi:hypothetical protein
MDVHMLPWAKVSARETHPPVSTWPLFYMFEQLRHLTTIGKINGFPRKTDTLNPNRLTHFTQY